MEQAAKEPRQRATKRTNTAVWLGFIPLPSLVLLAMTLWWTVPAFILELLAHPFREYFSSHLQYLITIAMCLIWSLVLGIVDAANPLWQKSGYWGRFILVWVFYLLQMTTTLAVFLSLVSSRTIDYYGADPEGSIGMLFLPSVAFYFLLGLGAGTLLELARLCLRLFGKKIVKSGAAQQM
jgi:hypothetical protein